MTVERDFPNAYKTALQLLEWRGVPVEDRAEKASQAIRDIRDRFHIETDVDMTEALTLIR